MLFCTLVFKLQNVKCEPVTKINLQLYTFTIISNIKHFTHFISYIQHERENTTWIEKNDELETDILGDVKLEVNELAQDGVETVCKLSCPKQCQGQQVKLLTIGQRGLVLEKKETK